MNRVLNHARRLEASIESAVQLHFSATAHRTNQVVRRLTVIAAIFAPLTLISGIWGMYVHRIPLADHPHGFGLIVGGMTAVALVLFLYFTVKRFLSDRPTGLRRWWRRELRRDPTQKARSISAP